ncbi:hypothetical protein RHO15_07660 [Utexia brackfieldae]|uniref:hypothetical protein n=1 Tax=Utexia brackfieldae TaxID=3074108 RepID=UPI00370D7C05
MPLLLLFPLLISCHTNKDKQISAASSWLPDMATAELGRYPLDVADMILAWNNQHLSDPELISQVTFSEPRAEYVITDSAHQQAILGYAVCVEIANVNAATDDKPSTHWYLIYNDDIIQHRQLLTRQDWQLDPTHQINCQDLK